VIALESTAANGEGWWPNGGETGSAGTGARVLTVTDLLSCRGGKVELQYHRGEGKCFQPSLSTSYFFFLYFFDGLSD
jgi:hypothetical protein